MPYNKLIFDLFQVNLASFIPNEEWQVVKFDIYRHEVISLINYAN